jgi:predicted HD superfamily hydrolase involved in NAD metabolism
MNYTTLARKVRTHIGQDHRYAHVVRVARCADIFAQSHALDARKARLAGMLHDLARLYSPTRLIDECERRNFTIDAFERANPVVLHARLGAAIAREAFGIDDPEVLSAIAKHTVGDGAMSPLDCVVYLADGLEPDRKFSERAQLWELARHDLRAAMRGTLATTIAYQLRQGRSIAPQTAAAAKQFDVRVEEATFQ